MGYLRRVVPNKDTTQNIEVETDSEGRMLDANTREILEPGKVDRGHKYGFEERVMQCCAQKCHMSQKDYRNMMQDSRLYQWESSYNNRSGKFECKDFSVQIHNCMEVIRSYCEKQRTRTTPKFKSTEFSPKLKSSSKNISRQKYSSSRAASRAKTISGARTGYGSFSAAKGRNSTGTAYGGIGGSRVSTGAGHGGAGSGGHGASGVGSHGGSSGGGHGGHSSEGGHGGK